MNQPAITPEASAERAFAPFAEKMVAEGLPPIAIRTFRHYYQKLRQGDTGFIPGEQALPVDDLPAAQSLDPSDQAAGEEALSRLIVLKLNGGLGTSMGMTGPKSMIEVKAGHTFLDIVAQQVLHLRHTHQSRLPLTLMNSFSTRQDSLDALAAFPEIRADLPLDFVQHKVPKIWVESLDPAAWPQDPDKEWCPPGHGDIYPALLSSGMLAEMLAAGYEYAFVSNIDNLGATVDLAILGYFVRHQLPFLMEVTRRTPADRKGGHLARKPTGSLLLREIAQCPPEEVEAFQDIDRYRYFNTNNLWVHLPTLQRVMDEHDGLLDLPMIRNQKPVDPTQPDSPQVYQLETAMGLAISAFPGAQALDVPRSRFHPVKTCNDLLVLWSDAYELTRDFHLRLHPDRSEAPLVELDDAYYKLFDEMRGRFPHGAPSLLGCDYFGVLGDVHFGRDVTIRGSVTVENLDEEPLVIEDGEVLGE
jgi:UTP--glucose-1-phosphate uridylyltransferase